MTITDCVKMALSNSGHKQAEMVPVWGFSSPQAMNNKFSRGSWSAEDLVRLAAFTGGKLLIEYPDGQKILIRSDNVQLPGPAKADPSAESATP